MDVSILDTSFWGNRRLDHIIEITYRLGYRLTRPGSNTHLPDMQDALDVFLQTREPLILVREVALDVRDEMARLETLAGVSRHPK